MAHWLMKSEPESYGWDDLVRDGGTEWDGVRNNAARLHLKAMKPGDEAFFYHSMSDKAVVGIMRVTRGAEPDPKDAGLGQGPGRAGAAAARPVTLAEIKAEPRLAKMELIRQSRLSVAPVRDEEWKVIWRWPADRRAAARAAPFDIGPRRQLHAGLEPRHDLPDVRVGQAVAPRRHAGHLDPVLDDPEQFPRLPLVRGVEQVGRLRLQAADPCCAATADGAVAGDAVRFVGAEAGEDLRHR